MFPLETVTCRNACLQCITACQSCIMMCPTNAATEGAIKLVADCADACRMALDFIGRESNQAGAAMLFCANTCEACAKETEKHPNDYCQECADVSWAAAQVFRWSCAKAA